MAASTRSRRYTHDERAALMTLARTFDEIPRTEHRASSSASDGRDSAWRRLQPAYDVAGRARAAWLGAGVRARRTCRTGGGQARRSASVATTNYGGSDLLYVFSSSTVFDADVSYSKFAAYAVLEHGGDFRRAALALSRLGYGSSSSSIGCSRRIRSRLDSPSRTSPTTDRLIQVAAANTIAIEPVSWLWADWLPLGAFVLLGGREGIGKSMFAYTLAADVTRGRLPGVYTGVPRSVLVAATEDSWTHTIVPRLMAAEADLARVYRIDVLAPDGTELVLTLPKDTPAWPVSPVRRTPA